MPGAAGRLLKGSVCKYEHTPDEDFIIDRHPLHSNVLVAGGFSGHGFKFSSVVGEILADMATSGATNHNIQPFRYHVLHLIIRKQALYWRGFNEQSSNQ